MPSLSSLAVDTSLPNWPFCARDLGPKIPDRKTCSWSLGLGLRPPGGWAVSYRLAVVLTLAAGPSARSLVGARGVRPAHRRRWSPLSAPTSRAPLDRWPARPGLVCRRSRCCWRWSAPRRWSGTDTRTGWPTPLERRWTPGVWNVQPQTFGCGSPMA